MIVYDDMLKKLKLYLGLSTVQGKGNDPEPDADINIETNVDTGTITASNASAYADNDEQLQSDTDELLLLMLSDAVYAVLNYCHVKRLNHSLETVAIQMAKRKFNEDNEGLLSDIKMGEVSIAYQNPISAAGFTDTEKAILNANRKVIVR